MRQSLVPVATFLLAVAIAALTPSSRHLLRAAGETTGCTVSCTVTGMPTTQPIIEGKGSIRDKGKKAVRQAMDQGFKKLKVDTTDPTLNQELNDAVDEIFAKNFDAYTITDASFGIDGINKTDNVWTVTGTFDMAIVILLPKDAKPGDQLSNHEDGHKLIAENTVEYAKKKIKALVEAAGCDEAAIRAAFTAGAQAALDVQNAANKDYDAKTTNGTVGGPNGQIPAAQAAWAAAVAANP
jgi:hypothetical protein